VSAVMIIAPLGLKQALTERFGRVVVHSPKVLARPDNGIVRLH
jgi:hypothetical protein